jgi:hypothetical protein
MQQWEPREGDTASIEVRSDADGVTIVVAGKINENCRLRVPDRLADGAVRVDLGQVAEINSIGLREWTIFLARLCAGREVSLYRCPEMLVYQMNAVVEATATARVASFYGPYSCPSCGDQASMLIEVAGHPELAAGRVPAPPCGECGAAMDFDELPGRYLGFLRGEPPDAAAGSSSPMQEAEGS